MINKVSHSHFIINILNQVVQLNNENFSISFSTHCNTITKSRPPNITTNYGIMPENQINTTANCAFFVFSYIFFVFLAF